MVTKARIFDQCMQKLEAVLAAKILRVLVDFSGQVENLLKEIRSAFQLGNQGHEARPIRAAPGTGSGAITTGTTFFAHSNPRGTTDRSTIRLNSSTGGDTVSTGATPSLPEAASTPSISDPTRQEPIPDSLNTDGHSVTASVGYGRPSRVSDSSNRKSRADQPGHPDLSGFRSSQPAEESQICPNKSVWWNPGGSSCQVSPPHETASARAASGDERGAEDSW